MPATLGRLTPIRLAGLTHLRQEHGGDLVSVENPTSTLEDLVLGIVRESQQRPGHRSAGVDKKD